MISTCADARRHRRRRGHRAPGTRSCARVANIDPRAVRLSICRTRRRSRSWTASMSVVRPLRTWSGLKRGAPEASEMAAWPTDRKVASLMDGWRLWAKAPSSLPRHPVMKTPSRLQRFGRLGRNRMRVDRDIVSDNVVLGSQDRLRTSSRFRIILACAEGGSAKQIAARLCVPVRPVERWRGRFLRQNVFRALGDLARRGHAPKFNAVTEHRFPDHWGPRPSQWLRASGVEVHPPRHADSHRGLRCARRAGRRDVRQDA